MRGIRADLTGLLTSRMFRIVQLVLMGTVLIGVLLVLPQLHTLNEWRNANTQCTAEVTAVCESSDPIYVSRMANNRWTYEVFNWKFAYTYGGKEYHEKYSDFGPTNAFIKGQSYRILVEPGRPWHFLPVTELSVEDRFSHLIASLVVYGIMFVLLAGVFGLGFLLANKPLPFSEDDAKMRQQAEDGSFAQHVQDLLTNDRTLMIITTFTTILFAMVLWMTPDLVKTCSVLAQRRACTYPVQATVEKMETVMHYYPKGSDRIQYMYVFRYDCNGKEYRSFHPLIAEDNVYSEGEQLVVRVDPEDPGHFSIVNDSILNDALAFHARICVFAILPFLIALWLQMIACRRQRIYIAPDESEETELTPEEAAAYEQWVQEHNEDQP